ncbi:hypothetical protein BDQ94DRAFT_144058 [Aspergillus welwitschiae]|uniref:Uncharacterized protein n=1 Tax=Aspergillus welwitschiae TaxID=1341132 RepID=A0A3F3Q2G1_9EURO|nr:hypothetical protein BDQ94DRAFT_144058 [Aspergillus welwitschiae]RDH33389.1 hypothetical protein BDQ94DRAFT_144058 [Aspergillus welwitschiae]
MILYSPHPSGPKISYALERHFSFHFFLFLLSFFFFFFQKENLPLDNNALRRIG